MNPGTIFWQSIVTGASLVVTAVLADPSTVAWVAAAAFALAVALNAGYARALAAKGRSERRIVGDHHVAACAGAALLVPLLAAAVAAVAGHDPRSTPFGFTANETAAILIALALLWVIVLLSSLIDWYYIRPNLDGVVTEPLCRSSDYGHRKRLTRRWYLHRGIVTLAYFAFALVVALVLMLMLVREHPTAAGVVGGVGGIAGLMLIFAGSYRSQLPTVAKWTLSPAFVLGDDISYEAHRWRGRGYVLHVAVPVVKLIPLDDAGLPTGARFVERKNSDLEEADIEPRATVACAAMCRKLNPECLAPETRLDRRTRTLVL